MKMAAIFPTHGRPAGRGDARQVLTWRVGTGRPADLSGLAVACGFADQAHMSASGALTGLSPTRWMKAELRFVQDGSAGAVAPSNL